MLEVSMSCWSARKFESKACYKLCCFIIIMTCLHLMTLIRKILGDRLPGDFMCQRLWKRSSRPLYTSFCPGTAGSLFTCWSQHSLIFFSIGTVATVIPHRMLMRRDWPALTNHGHIGFIGSIQERIEDDNDHFYDELKECRRHIFPAL